MLYIILLVFIAAALYGVWLNARIIRQAQLLWLLAVAVEKQLPLADEVEAYADDSRGRWRYKLLQLAELLRSGASLPVALDRVRGLLSPNALLAVRVGAASGTLAKTLRVAADAFTTRKATTAGSPNSILLYTFVLFWVMAAIVSFIMIYIIPKFKKIFEDFGTELPSLTILVIDLSDTVVTYSLLLVPLMLFLMWMVAVCHVALVTRQVPRAGPFGLLGALLPRLFVPDILRMLVVIVEAGRPLPGAFTTLSTAHPNKAMRRRLGRIADRLLDGSDTWRVLAHDGLLTNREAAVLDSAQRVGNLPWALGEMANAISRRLNFRWGVLLELVRPVLILGLASMIAFIVVGMFLPLVKLIHDLS